MAGDSDTSVAGCPAASCRERVQDWLRQGEGGPGFGRGKDGGLGAPERGKRRYVPAVHRATLAGVQCEPVTRCPSQAVGRGALYLQSPPTFRRLQCAALCALSSRAGIAAPSSSCSSHGEVQRGGGKVLGARTTPWCVWSSYRGGGRTAEMNCELKCG